MSNAFFVPCRRHPLALAAMLLIAGASQAQTETVAQASARGLPAVTVTATMTEHDVRTAPASVTVITAEDLAEKNAADLLDAVRGAPGITLQGRQVGGRKTLALRGLQAERFPTAKLTDSQAVIDPDTSSASLRISYDSGPVYKYGPVQIKGAERYDPVIIERLTRVPRGAAWIEGGYEATAPMSPAARLAVVGA